MRTINAGHGTLGDLWEYKPSTGEWTWQGGPDTEADPTTAQGVYGTQGQPAASNLPGPRSSAMTWTDASGNFWMFGGFGYDSIGIFGDLNDLWEIASHQASGRGKADATSVGVSTDLAVLDRRHRERVTVRSLGRTVAAISGSLADPVSTPTTIPGPSMIFGNTR